MGFRISFGNFLARKNKNADEIDVKICCEVAEKISYLKKLNFNQFVNFNEDQTDTFRMNDKQGFTTVFVERLGEDTILVVAQCLFPTWNFPNHISLSGPSKVYVDGFIINSVSQITPASPSLLYKYS